MGVNFDLYGRKIEFNNDQIEYNKCRLYYENLASKCANKYISEIYEKYGGLDKFHENGLEGGWKIISEAVAITVQKCVDVKIYDIDENSFLEQYGEKCFTKWAEAFDDINDKYLNIVMKAEELDEYRSQRKQSRGRIVGGGFGLQGAATGMIQAGAINMATGAIHGAFNLVGKGFSMIGDSLDKSLIYTNKENKDVLWNGIYWSVFNIHDALCNIFKIPVITSSNVKTADTLFNNISKMRQEDVIENVVKIIFMNPYKYNAYEYCIKTYGDEQNEVQKIANFFGYDVEGFKNSLLETMYGKFDLSNEQNALITKENLQEAISKYGLTTFERMKEIEKKLELFDQQARIVDGVTFATREEASIVFNELQKIKLLMKNSDLRTLQGVEGALSVLSQKEFSTSVKDKYVAELNIKLENIHKKEIQQIIRQGNTMTVEGIMDVLSSLENGKYAGDFFEQEKNKLYEKKKKLDNQAVSVGEICYESKEEAEKAKLEIDKVNKILKQCNLSTVLGAQSALQQLKAEKLETRSGLAKILEVETKFTILEEKERTVKGKVFNTKEEVQSAKNKARIFPIIVFLLIVGMLFWGSDGVNSFRTNLFRSIGSACVPWALFAFVKPQPATFYILSSRLKALGTFVLLFIVLMLAGIP